ncbi:winged helix-turn-helix transcriptional regulator [Candidatus Bipolaricaulota bacterium]|nr:winged helix-turn-helix transcriptional regulator [Candidatus Bipolaricaulota bacterium]TFH09620.1 MAG: ArsR family transcriptional regulator [Candidatus Atribacteria bacterium]
MKNIPLSEQTQQLERILSALANPARLRILEILAERPRTIVAEIVAQLPIAQATVSQHLLVLRDAGLIYGERDSHGQCCLINYETVSQFAQSMIAWTLRLATIGIATGETESLCS